MSALVTVANPDPEAIPSRKVHNVALYHSARCDLRIRIRHWSVRCL